MSCLSDRFELRAATTADTGQILKIYEEQEFDGVISVIHTRRPDPYLSLSQEGERVFLYVCHDHREDIICGAGACVLRKVYIKGEFKTAGYLTGLKLLPQYQKKVPYIADAYKFMHEQTKDLVDCYYTTILIGNSRAQGRPCTRRTVRHRPQGDGEKRTRDPDQAHGHPVRAGLGG